MALIDFNGVERWESVGEIRWQDLKDGISLDDVAELVGVPKG